MWTTWTKIRKTFLRNRKSPWVGLEAVGCWLEYNKILLWHLASGSCRAWTWMACMGRWVRSLDQGYDGADGDGRLFGGSRGGLY